MLSSASPSLSVVVPVYNEERRLSANLSLALAYLKSLPHSFELIVVDDGSTDRTAGLVETQLQGEPHARLITYAPNRGKGHAVRTGVLDSRGERVVFLDADLSTPVEEIPRALELLESAEVVIGSRALPDSQIALRPPLYRRAATGIFDLIKHALVGLWDLSDTQCGFKAYRGEVARALFQRSRVDRFMFDVEILYLARRAGLKIVEMPVRWADVAGSKVRFLEGVVNMVRDLVRIRWIHRGAWSETGGTPTRSGQVPQTADDGRRSAVGK